MSSPSQSHPEPLPLYTYTFVLGSIYNFLLGLAFASNALYPIFVERNGGDLSVIGLFMGIFFVAAMLGRPLHGAMIDAWGVRMALLTATLCMSLPALAFMFFIGGEMTPLLFLLRCIQGFGWGAHMSAFFTLVGQNAPPTRKNEAVAMYGMAGMIGGAFGPLMGEFLIRVYGLEAFFLMTAGVGLIAMGVTQLFPRSEATDKRDRFTMHGVRTVIVMKRFRLAFLIAICHAAAYSTIANFITVVMNQREIESFTLFFTLFSFAGVSTRLFSSHWADRYGYMPILLPGFIVYTIGLLLLQVSHSLPMVMAAGVVCGIGHGITFPIVITLGYTLSPERYRGSGMALITGMFDVGNSVCAILLGILGYWFGYHVVILGGSVFPLIAALAIFIWGAQYSREALHK